MAVLKVKIEQCKGCGLCVRACPKGLMRLSKTTLNSRGYQPAEISDMQACIACAACARSCPDIAIEIEK
ncbi:MAG: 4Fe-4S dicluster domain-containing protein [Bacillota bacterium]|nr:4Fe-4S dicluster domain-containing protein [Bacillota bacterium]